LGIVDLAWSGPIIDHATLLVYAIADGNEHARDLYLTLLGRMGVRPESIGDSTGRLEHLDLA
jgi:hypothetical protein